MKNNYRRLQALLKMFDMDLFYCIRYYETNVVLQGRPTDELTNLCIKYKFKTDYSEKYTQFKKSNVTIVLL